MKPSRPALYVLSPDHVLRSSVISRFYSIVSLLSSLSPAIGRRVLRSEGRKALGPGGWQWRTENRAACQRCAPPYKYSLHAHPCCPAATVFSRIDQITPIGLVPLDMAGNGFCIDDSSIGYADQKSLSIFACAMTEMGLQTNPKPRPGTDNVTILMRAINHCGIQGLPSKRKKNLLSRSV